MLTLGCRVNQYETEFIRSQWEKAGGVECGDMDNAQYICINSCAVTSNARKGNRETPFIGQRRSNPEAYIIMTGCAARLYSILSGRAKRFFGQSPTPSFAIKTIRLQARKALRKIRKIFPARHP